MNMHYRWKIAAGIWFITKSISVIYTVIYITYTVGRPTYMSADLCFTTDSSFFFLLLLHFFVSYSPRSLNRTEPKPVTCSKVSAIWKACRKSGVSPPNTNRGLKNHLFGRLRSSTANLTAYIFGTKHDTDNRASALQTTRGLLHRLKTTNGFKLEVSFHLPSVNSAFHFIAGLRRRRSANGT